MAHPGLTNAGQYAAMLGDGVRAVPAGQQHDSDAFERFGDRGVIVEITFYDLNAFRRRKSGRVADEGANRSAGASKGIQRRASDLACRCGDKDHDSARIFEPLTGGG